MSEFAIRAVEIGYCHVCKTSNSQIDVDRNVCVKCAMKDHRAKLGSNLLPKGWVRVKIQRGGPHATYVL